MSDEARCNQTIWGALMRKINQGILGSKKANTDTIARLRYTISVLNNEVWELRGKNEQKELQIEQLNERVEVLTRIAQGKLRNMAVRFKTTDDGNNKDIGF